MNSLPAPPAYPHVELEPQRDTATQAVIRYLTSSDVPERGDAFDDLVALCYGWTKKMRNKQTGVMEPRYFLRDRHGSLKVEPTEPEQCFTYSDLDGKRTDYTIRNEGDALNVTRLWVQSWILNFLTPYHNQTPDQILAAADSGKFRYLGLWCRMALKKLVYRQQKREAKEQFAGHTTVTENLGTSEMGASSSLRTHMPFNETELAVNEARRVVMANAGPLGELDLLTGLLACLSVAEHVTEPHFDKRVTQAIMDALGVKERAAQKHKQRYYEIIGRELAAGNPVLLAIIAELTAAPPTFIGSTESDEETKEGEDNRRLRRESRQLMAEFARETAA